MLILMKNENAAYFRWPLSEKFLRIIFSVFILVFVVVVLRLFRPFVQCVREWGDSRPTAGRPLI